MVDNFNGIVMPNANFFTAPLLYDDMRKHIWELWWENPTRSVSHVSRLTKWQSVYWQLDSLNLTTWKPDNLASDNPVSYNLTTFCLTTWQPCVLQPDSLVSYNLTILCLTTWQPCVLQPDNLVFYNLTTFCMTTLHLTTWPRSISLLKLSWCQ